MEKKLLKLKSLLAVFVVASMVSVAFGQTTNLPVIDGDGSDAAWSVGTEWPIAAIIDADAWDDANDLSGTVTVVWSADSLYILCKVTDDELYFGSGAAYEYDNICVYIDAYNKATTSYVDSTQMYFEKHWWDADHMGGRLGPNWMAPPGNWGADTALADDNQYVIEIAYAWSSAQKTPAVGDVVGFDVKLSDNDGPAEAENRDQIAWRDITDTGWTNPMVWGEITLEADGSVSGQTDFVPTTDAMDERAWTFVPAWGLNAEIDKSSVSNDADFSGNVKLMWTMDSLYVKVDVADDDLHTGPGDAFNYDNIMINFDVFNKATGSYIDTTQMYYEHNWWQAYDQLGGRYGPDWMAPPPGNFAVDTADGSTGYTIELTVGWDEFGVDPAVGTVMGFDVKLSDNDDDGVDGGAGRDQIAWRDITDTGWTNPSVFGNITLEADGMVSGQNDFFNVDGDISGKEWAMAPTFNIDAGVNGAPTVFNNRDLDGTFKLVWNEDQILFQSLVYDDTLYSADDTWYLNDNIAIFFDLYKKNTDSYVDTTQFYYERHWWGADSTGLGARWGADWNWPPADAYTTVLTDTSYIIELALNWTDFIPEALDAGSVIGFDVKLSDRDSEGIARDQVSWKDDTDNAWQWPNVFGSLKLLANGNVEEYMGPAAVSGLAAAVEGANVTLTWDAVEGAAGYNVYRGETMIGDAITEVTLTDAGLDMGDYTYSVSAVDAYGIEGEAATADASVTVGIENSVTRSVMVYPNPASEVINLRSAELMQTVNVISISGQIIESVDVNAHSSMIDISEMNSGIYIVNVKMESSTQNYRIIVR